jgi:hypothetical protein
MDKYDNEALGRNVGNDCRCKPAISVTNDNNWCVVQHHWHCSMYREPPEVFETSLMDLLTLSVGKGKRERAELRRWDHTDA